MLGGTAGIVDVNLVLVRVDVSHVLADPPLLPAAGYFIAALATFGIVPRHPSGESCNRVLSNVIVISGLPSYLVRPAYHFALVCDDYRIILNEMCGFKFFSGLIMLMLITCLSLISFFRKLF